MNPFKRKKEEKEIIEEPVEKSTKEKAQGGLFSKLFKKNGNKEEKQPKASKVKGMMSNKDKKKSKKVDENNLSSVLNISVPETLLEELTNNSRFTYIDGKGETRYVAFMLKTDDIGGLNKKSKNDEDKGQLIELINAAHIKCLVTEQTFEDNVLIFLPEEDTISHLGEFSFLHDKPLYIVFVDEDCNYEITQASVLYQELRLFYVSEQPVNNLLFQKGILKYDVSENESIDENQDNLQYELVEETQDYNEVVQEESEPNQQEDEIIQADEDSSIDEEISEINVEDEQNEDGYYTDDDEDDDLPFGNDEVVDYSNDDEDFTSDDVYIPNDEVNLDDVDMIDTRVIDKQEFDSAVKRLFSSDDLNLEVTTQPFDDLIANRFEYRPFNEMLATSWLNDYLKDMYINNNDRLNLLHQKNVIDARNKYLAIMSKACDDIIKGLDYTNPENISYHEYEEIKAINDSYGEKAAVMISEAKEKVIEEYEKKREKAGEIGRENALSDFDLRNKTQHKKELDDVANDISKKVDSEMKNNLDKLLDKRKLIANKQLDLCQNEALNIINKELRNKFEEENALYLELSQQARGYIDLHQKDEINYNTLQHEQLKHSTEVEDITNLMKRRLDEQAMDYERNKKNLLEDIEQIKRDSKKEIEEIKKDAERKVLDAQHNVDAQKEHFASIVEDYKKLDKERSDDFKNRLEEKNRERDELIEAHNKFERKTRNSHFFILTMSVVAVLASLFVGMLFGSKVDSIAQPQPIQQEQSVESSN